LKNTLGNINRRILDDFVSRKSKNLYHSDDIVGKLSEGFKDVTLKELKL
jgi:hypothetical protein